MHVTHTISMAPRNVGLLGFFVVVVFCLRVSQQLLDGLLSNLLWTLMLPPG